MKVAAIANDMSEMNVDARLVELNKPCLGRLHLLHLTERPAERAEKLATEGRFDYSLIESTGILGPLPVAQAFSYSMHEWNGA